MVIFTNGYIYFLCILNSRQGWIDLYLPFQA